MWNWCLSTSLNLMNGICVFRRSGWLCCSQSVLRQHFVTLLSSSSMRVEVEQCMILHLRPSLFHCGSWVSIEWMQTNTRFQNNAYCSYSDRGLLHGLSKGIMYESKLDTLVAKQKQDLNHALTCETHTHTHTHTHSEYGSPYLAVCHITFTFFTLTRARFHLLPISVTLSSFKTLS